MAPRLKYVMKKVSKIRISGRNLTSSRSPYAKFPSNLALPDSRIDHCNIIISTCRLDERGHHAYGMNRFEIPCNISSQRGFLFESLILLFVRTRKLTFKKGIVA